MSNSANNQNPNELKFWRNHLANGSILSALKTFPEQAAKVFGAIPTMRADILQLGMILGAREILAEPPGHMTFEKSDAVDLIEKRFRVVIDKLPEGTRSKCLNLLSQENTEKTVKNMAREIIKEATGIEPE